MIECTKLLTGAPQARRFAAMCASGFGHRAEYSFSKALLVTLRVSDEAGIGISTKGGLGHQCSLENRGTENSKYCTISTVAGSRVTRGPSDDANWALVTGHGDGMLLDFGSRSVT